MRPRREPDNGKVQLRSAILLLAALALPPGARAAAPRSPRPSAPRVTLRQERQWLAPALRAARTGRWDEAYWLASEAAHDHPPNAFLADIRSALAQRAVMEHLTAAQRSQEHGRELEAAVQYRTALGINPDSEAARRGLAQVLQLPAGESDMEMRVEQAAPPPQLELAPGLRSFHLDTGLRQAIGAVAAAYGLRAYIQNSIPDRPVRLRIGEASFGQAMRVLGQLGGVRWIPLGAHTIYAGQARQAQRFEPLEMRTFYLPWLEKPADLAQVEQTLRTILAPYEVQGDAATRSITVRARPVVVDAAEQLLLDLGGGPGGVLFEVEIAEVSRSLARQLGVTTPYQLQALALGPILRQLSSAGASESQLLQDLFQSGGLNNLLGAGQISQQLAALESQLAPLLGTPFLTFGGGLTAMALTLPPATLNLSLNTSRSTQLQTAWLRAEAGHAATLQVGERYPVVNATFSPILDSAAIQKVLGSGAFRPPFPSFTFVNLGLTLHLTPYLDGQGQIMVKVRAQERALSGVSNNGIPILEDHKLSTLVDLRDGEPALVAGLRSRQNTEIRAALPGLGAIPGLGDAFGSTQTNRQRDELVVIITPHVLRAARHAGTAIWLPASDFRRGSGPVNAPPYTPPVPFPQPRPPRRAPPGGTPRAFPLPRHPAAPVMPRGPGEAAGRGTLGRGPGGASG